MSVCTELLRGKKAALPMATENRPPPLDNPTDPHTTNANSLHHDVSTITATDDYGHFPFFIFIFVVVVVIFKSILHVHVLQVC